MDLDIMADDWLDVVLGPGVGLKADLNTDGTVNFKDYVFFGNQWLEDQRWPNW